MPTTLTTRRPLLAVGALLLAAASLAGCSSGTTQTTDTPADTPAAEQSVSPAVTLVDAPTAQALIDKGVPVLDVRRPDEFAAGHVEGAVNINLEDPAFADEVAALDATSPWVVYCRTGRRSAVAAAQMESAGFTRLYDMSGGIVAWEQAGQPVTTS